MSVQLTINGIDYTTRSTRVVRRFRNGVMESLDAELFNASLSDLDVGNTITLSEGGATTFEGIIYERETRKRSSDITRASITAYTKLINYERHIVYRSYPAGTLAGEIIRDLASLESGVDTTNVDDGETLMKPWEVENRSALDVMLSVARGTNYWLRMKPGGRLYFKPKSVGAPIGVVSEDDVASAEYGEDRWRMRNRVIYVGSGGEVLADVSEGAGDMPLIVHDPFLTDQGEAQRRASVRLQLSKEYSKQLRLALHRRAYESLSPDLGDTITVSLPSMGIAGEDMVVVEMEYEPASVFRWITLGGRRELLEELLSDRLGGDEAALFGQRLTAPEMVSTVYQATILAQGAVKIQARGKTVRHYNKPPLNIANATNITIDQDGYATLIAGATSGSFDFISYPSSQLFSRWLRAYYDAEDGEGSLRVDLLRADGGAIALNIPQDYEIPYLPRSFGAWTEQNSHEWGAVNAVLSDSPMGAVSWWSITAERDTSAASMELIFPKTRDAGWSIREHRYMVLYLYTPSDGTLEIRLHTDQSNYLSGSIALKGGVWARYTIALSSMASIGAPDKSNINWMSLITSLPSLSVDSDYVFQPALREKLVMRFTITRPTQTAKPHRVKLAKLVWRES